MLAIVFSEHYRSCRDSFTAWLVAALSREFSGHQAEKK